MISGGFVFAWQRPGVGTRDPRSCTEHDPLGLG